MIYDLLGAQTNQVLVGAWNPMLRPPIWGCRYIDILPSPATRVKLSQIAMVPTSDYINANYVRGYNNEKKEYIAAQGAFVSALARSWGCPWPWVWGFRGSVSLLGGGRLALFFPFSRFRRSDCLFRGRLDPYFL